ncbi:MAG: flagellar biosynthetic protein FliO, partial [Planctomycetota bacterium]
MTLLLCACVANGVYAQLKNTERPAEAPSPLANQRMVEMAERMAGVDRDTAVAASSATPEVVVSPIEATPLGQAPATRRTGFNQDGLVGDDADAAKTPTPSWSGGSILSTLAALGVVIGLIFGVRLLLAKATKTPLVSTTSAVEVLSRTSVAPRSHVLLLRVGSQVLVVGESSGGLRTLSAVQNEEDVAALL